MNTPISHRITQVFELKKGQHPYKTIFLLTDERGFTCGWAGFTTADEEPVLLVEEYTRRVGKNHLSGDILDELRFLRDKGSGDTQVLDKIGFKTHWENAASTPEFQEAYEDVVATLFGLPAQSHCADLHLQSPVAHAILFDTVIQHGDDGDPDSTGAIIERTNEHHIHIERGFLLEKEFLLAFLAERRKTLLKPFNEDTADEWRESVSRTYALENLVLHNSGLKLPVRLESEELDEVIR